MLVSLFCTLFEFLDIPVFWPFLLTYFVFLVLITLKKLMNYRDKLGYSFFDKNKYNKN